VELNAALSYVRWKYALGFPMGVETARKSD
jgi:hypothetical protein